MYKTVNEKEIIYTFKSKERMLSDYIDNMDEMDKFDLWTECAYSGAVEPVERMDSIDDTFSVTQIMHYDLLSFDIDDAFFYEGDYWIQSYTSMDEVMEDRGGKDILINWLLYDGYDGAYDELKEFMRSEEYKEAV